MSDYEMMDKEEIYSKVLRAGRRTYFFDVRATKAGDYYLTVTESKKFTNDDGSFHYKKHKIYLYKEVISERHQKDFKRDDDFVTNEAKTPEDTKPSTDSFTDISFDDI